MSAETTVTVVAAAADTPTAARKVAATGSQAFDGAGSKADAAARTLQERWREYYLLKQVRAFCHCNRVLTAQREQAEAEREAANQEKRDREARGRTLPGILERVWPIVREVGGVMAAAVVLGLTAPRAFGALPAPFDVRPDDPPAQQARAAVAGASLAAAAFTALLLALIALYLGRWERALHALHSMWVGSLLGLPLALLFVRVCEAARAPLDALTLGIAVWNAVVPGVVLVHWAPTATRFEVARRAYAALLSIGCAWALACVPYPTAITALLELALLDVVLVSLPGSPVQRLDAIASARRRAGEAQMPGLTFKASGLELGLGDFIVYSTFAARAARVGVAPLLAVTVGVLGGLVPTMSHVALARQRTVVPALPLSVALAATLLLAVCFAVRPVADALAAESLFT